MTLEYHMNLASKKTLERQDARSFTSRLDLKFSENLLPTFFFYHQKVITNFNFFP